MFLNALKLDGFHFVSLYNKLKIKINLSDDSENLYNYGCYSKDLVNFLQINLKDSDVLVDCGANFGLWTLFATQ
jgi:hypothetical protein